ncbi:MAG TPA: flagellar filament capping protein FliD [Terriglobales bacterium]|nr:flagellar filament capping protein FliD [Terriglobales bacterium]
MGITFNASTLLNGNGIDVDSVVSQIQAQESGELTVWQNQQSTLQTQASDLTSISTDLSSLATAVQSLADPLGALAGMSATSSEPGILTATAQPSATAGNHTVVVSTLATAGTVYTDPVSSASASILPSGATGGDLQLQVGGASGTTYDIPITPGGNDTLTTLASYINQQSTAGKWGVTASVLNDANGARLAIYSTATGTAGALAITTNTTTGALSTADLSGADSSILPGGQQNGDIQLQIGGSSGSTEDIPITAGSNDTLNTLASYINTQSTQNNWGVTATVVQDSNGYHLSISSQAQGAAGALAFTSNNTTLTTVANAATDLTFETPVGGGNATFTVDGVPFSSTTNTITGAIPNLTLNLVSAYQDMPVTVSVGMNTDGVTTALNNFVSAYNKVITDLNQQFAVNQSTGEQGPLGSDTALSLLQSSLLNDVTYSVTGNSGIVNLASLGINMNDDGTLTVDSTTLSNTLQSNPDAVQTLFQGSSSNGFANSFNTDLTQLTNPTSGLLNVDLTQNQAEQTDLTNQINAFQTQLASQKQELLQEYNNLNASLEEYPYLLQEVTEQLGTLGLSSSSSSQNSNSTPTSGSSSNSNSGTSSASGS